MSTSGTDSFVGPVTLLVWVTSGSPASSSHHGFVSRVRHPHPHGRPQFTYGHSLNKTHTRVGFPTEFKNWSELAENRDSWRAHVYGLAWALLNIQSHHLCAHHQYHTLLTRHLLPWELFNCWLDWGRSRGLIEVTIECIVEGVSLVELGVSYGA